MNPLMTFVVSNVQGGLRANAAHFSFVGVRRWWCGQYILVASYSTTPECGKVTIFDAFATY